MRPNEYNIILTACNISLVTVLCLCFTVLFPRIATAGTRNREWEEYDWGMIV